MAAACSLLPDPFAHRAGQVQRAAKHVDKAVALSVALGQLDEETEALMWAGHDPGSVSDCVQLCRHSAG